MRTILIYPDGIEGGWGLVGCGSDADYDHDPADLIDEHEQDLAMHAEDVACAIVAAARRVHVEQRCPAKLRPALRAIWTATSINNAAKRLGRCEKRMEQLLDEIATAVRCGEPVQTDLFPGGYGPLPPTRRGRPRGGKGGDK